MKTDRQQKLYDYLLKNANDWISQERIYQGMGIYPIPPDNRNFHDTQARIMITDDIRAINSNPEFEKIIITSRYGVKVANAEETSRYLNRNFYALFKRLKRLQTLRSKAEADGQIFLDTIDSQFKVKEVF